MMMATRPHVVTSRAVAHFIFVGAAIRRCRYTSQPRAFLGLRFFELPVSTRSVNEGRDNIRQCNWLKQPVPVPATDCAMWHRSVTPVPVHQNQQKEH